MRYLVPGLKVDHNIHAQRVHMTLRWEYDECDYYNMMKITFMNTRDAFHSTSTQHRQDVVQYQMEGIVIASNKNPTVPSFIRWRLLRLFWEQLRSNILMDTMVYHCILQQSYRLMARTSILWYVRYSLRCSQKTWGRIVRYWVSCGVNSST
jgi:hypothetical protein